MISKYQTIKNLKARTAVRYVVKWKKDIRYISKNAFMIKFHFLVADSITGNLLFKEIITFADLFLSKKINAYAVH